MSASTFRTERTTATATAHTTATASADTGAPPRGTGVFHYPSLTTTVPKEFVHRAAVAEVMLTDWEREDDTHFTLAAQWPRSHSFFTPLPDGHHDPLIVAETIRQAGALLAHAEFGVPLGHHFLMWDLQIAVHPQHLLVGDAPANLTIDIACTEVKQRGGTLSALRYEAAIRRDGILAATGSASYTCTSPAVYHRLRGDKATTPPPPTPLTAPTAPQSVGRMSPMDVVLTPIGEPDRWQLRVDTHHPVLFDHPTDHIPGMVLLEAARQAATTTLGTTHLLPHTLTSTFHRYAELNTPCTIHAHPQPPTPHTPPTIHITGHQNNQPVFHATLTTTP